MKSLVMAILLLILISSVVAINDTNDSDKNTTKIIKIGDYKNLVKVDMGNEKEIIVKQENYTIKNGNETINKTMNMTINKTIHKVKLKGKDYDGLVEKELIPYEEFDYTYGEEEKPKETKQQEQLECQKGNDSCLLNKKTKDKVGIIEDAYLGYQLYFILFLIGMVLIVLFLLIFSYKRKRKHGLEVPEEVADKLLKEGYSEKYVEEVFNSISKFNKRWDELFQKKRIKAKRMLLLYWFIGIPSWIFYMISDTRLYGIIGLFFTVIWFFVITIYIYKKIGVEKDE